MNWYKRNEMVANPDKFQLIFFGLKEDHELCIDIRGNMIEMSDTVKLLGVTIDSKLKFNGHVKTICQKTKNKVKAFSRIARNRDYQKASLLYNSFILTNFNYCPLIWMFCGKTANEEVNRVHKRALRVLLNDFDSNFEELLHRNEEVTCKGTCKKFAKTYVRGIQMYYLWKPLLSVGVLQLKDASI